MKYLPALARFLFGTAVCLLLAPALRAGSQPVNTTTFGSLALHGYDPVAYFSDHQPLEGRKDFTFEWQGANWRFASQAHLDQFKSSPEKYAPQYGGFCAYAMAKGSKADVDPAAWDIVNDKLYLNYSKDVQARWRPERAQFIPQADENWRRLVEPDKSGK